MGRVTVTVNGRTYRLECGDGEEKRLIELATYVGQCVDGCAEEFGAVGDGQLLFMAALMVTDELWDAREQIAKLEAGQSLPRVPPPLPPRSAKD